MNEHRWLKHHIFGSSPNRSGSFRTRFLPGRAIAHPSGSKLHYGIAGSVQISVSQ